jgi:hypothetical protein
VIGRRGIELVDLNIDLIIKTAGKDKKSRSSCVGRPGNSSVACLVMQNGNFHYGERRCGVNTKHQSTKAPRRFDLVATGEEIGGTRLEVDALLLPA